MANESVSIKQKTRVFFSDDFTPVEKCTRFSGGGGTSRRKRFLYVRNDSASARSLLQIRSRVSDVFTERLLGRHVLRVFYSTVRSVAFISVKFHSRYKSVMNRNFEVSKMDRHSFRSRNILSERTPNANSILPYTAFYYGININGIPNRNPREFDKIGRPVKNTPVARFLTAYPRTHG